MEDRHAAAQGTQLPGSAFAVAGFVEAPSAGKGDLVGADHQRVGKAAGHGASLGLGQSLRGIRRGFAG